MDSSTTQLITQTYRQPYTPLPLKKQEAVIMDLSESYTAFIWALAQKFTDSPEEAEAAVHEMQADIQRCERRGMLARTDEDRLVARIAWRRLLRYLQ